MQIRLYLKMLQSGWWIVVLATLSALVITLTLSYNKTPLYRASARFIIIPNSDETSGRDMVNSLAALDRRSIASTYVEVLKSGRIYEDTSKALQFEPTVLSSYKLSAVVLPEANILELSAVGPNPQIAMILTNTAGQQGINYIRNLYQVYTLSFLDKATVPSQPFSPDPVRDAGLSLVLGIILGTLLVIMRGHLNIPLDAIRRNTITDSLSSAYTRSHLLKHFDGVISQYPGNASFALVSFKQFEDISKTMPKAVTRQVLRQIVNRLHADLRGVDMIGRWSDVSFAIVLPATSNVGALSTIDRIRASFSRSLDIGTNEQLSFTPQFGIATHESGENADTVIERANTNLEQSHTSVETRHVEMQPMSA